MKSMDYTKTLERALRPEIAVPLVYLLFIVFAIISYSIPETSRYLIKPTGYFSKPAPISYLLALFSMAVLFASAVLGSRIKAKKGPILVMAFITAFLALHLTFELPLIIPIAASAGFAGLLVFISRNIDEKNIAWGAFFVAVLASASILYRGIPILETASREATAIDPTRAIFHGFAVFGAAYFIAFYKKKTALGAILFLIGLAILSGFKSDAIAVIASASVAGLLLDRVNVKEIAAGAAGVVLILAVAGTFIAEVSYSSWNIPGAYYIFYRAGLTFAVFDTIVAKSLPFGFLHGEALLDATQMVVSTKVLGELYAQPHIITSTLIGPGVLDFGILGAMAIAIFVGAVLGIMESRRESIISTCLYAIALTHTFILIEVGLQLTSILFYLSLLYLTVSHKRPKG